MRILLFIFLIEASSCTLISQTKKTSMLLNRVADVNNTRKTGVAAISYKYLGIDQKDTLEEASNCYYFRELPDKDSIASFYIVKSLAPVLLYNGNEVYRFFSFFDTLRCRVKDVGEKQLKQVSKGHADYNLIFIPFLKNNYYNAMIQAMNVKQNNITYKTTNRRHENIIVKTEIYDKKKKEKRVEKFYIDKDTHLLRKYSEKIFVAFGEQYQECSLMDIIDETPNFKLREKLQELLNQYSIVKD